MISILRFDAFISQAVDAVNAFALTQIKSVKLSPTESALIKKLSDTSGLVLAVKFPDADSNISSIDEYNEANHCLLFLLEKVDPGKFSKQKELEHYDNIQKVMQKVKEFILESGLNGSLDEGETLSKPFRTEWEYQIYGGFNGLSISFDLKDFRL